MTLLAVHALPVRVTRPCGGWLLWKTCTATAYRMSHRTEYKTVTEQETGCCPGYVQVGRYCAACESAAACARVCPCKRVLIACACVDAALNRSGELCARPGSCPAADGPCPGSTGCRWDVDCPGWQKCCQAGNRSLCREPTSECARESNVGTELLLVPVSTLLSRCDVTGCSLLLRYSESAVVKTTKSVVGTNGPGCPSLYLCPVKMSFSVLIPLIL